MEYVDNVCDLFEKVKSDQMDQVNDPWQELFESEDIKGERNFVPQDEENESQSERSTKSREHSSDPLEILEKIEKPDLFEIQNLEQYEGSYSELPLEDFKEECQEELELNIEKSLEPSSRLESQNPSEEDHEIIIENIIESRCLGKNEGQ